MKITDEMVEAGARAMCEAWHYAPIGSPDGDAEWKRKQDQYRKQSRAALTAALAVQTQQGVEVKPLEWEYMCLNGVKAAGGMYTLHDMDGNGKRIRAMFLGDDSYRWFVSIEHAKAAAQSDYETRIRSALVDVPAVESEPVGYTTEWHLNEVRNGRIGNIAPAGTMRPENEVPVYAHPPRSLSNEGWRPIETAPEKGPFLAYGAYLYPDDKDVTEYTSIVERSGDPAWPWETCEGNAAKEAFTHWQPLPSAPLSTRKGSSEGDGSATITKDNANG